MDVEHVRELVEDGAELARLVTRPCAAAISLNRTTLPDGPVPAHFHCADVRAQKRGDLELAVARDELYLAKGPDRQGSGGRRVRPEGA